MIAKIAIILATIVSAFSVLVILCCCKVSGDCSRQEEKEWEDGN